MNPVRAAAGVMATMMTTRATGSPRRKKGNIKISGLPTLGATMGINRGDTDTNEDYELLLHYDRRQWIQDNFNADESVSVEDPPTNRIETGCAPLYTGHSPENREQVQQT